MIDRSENDKPAETPEGERIAKVMARAGLCSRRDAERWIADGRVSVNGKVLESPAFNVKERDSVTVDGRPIAQRERTRLFMFHKPRGTVTTDRDPEGRSTIFDVLPEGLPRLVTIGRLDINTEGLLLLTNDGGLARTLELPATGWLRRYRVRAHGAIDQAQLDALAGGVVIEGVEYRGIEAKIDRTQGANVWLTMGLREGKNREIKRVLEHLGLAVNRLIRVSYGPFQLGELDEGVVEEVKTRILKDQLGEKLAAESGADFDAPVLDTKDREKLARRHPNEERPQRERHQPERHQNERPTREERGGERFQRRPSNGGRRDERGGQTRDEQPKERALSARDVVHTRKHVSVIRAEKAEQGEGRRKIERSETADRRGRSVPVERVSGGERDDARSGSRNARRFSSERNGAPGAETSGGDRGGWRRAEGGGERPARKAYGDRPPRREGGERPPRRDFGDRPPRKDFGDRPPRSGPGGAPARSHDFGDRAPRKDFGARPPRREGTERPPRKDFGDRPPRKEFGDRPARSGGFGDRPPRKDFGDRPPRREGTERPPRKDFGDRPPRKEFGDRPARSRDFGDRPPRKDFGDRPPRKDFGGERPARKDFGDRPPRREGGDRPPRKDFGDRPPRKDFGDRPPRKDFADRAPRADGAADARPGRSGGYKGAGGKSAGGFRSGGSKGPEGRSGGRSGGPGGKPGGRPGGGKPGGGRPGGKPGGGRSGGPRAPR